MYKKCIGRQEKKWRNTCPHLQNLELEEDLVKMQEIQSSDLDHLALDGMQIFGKKKQPGFKTVLPSERKLLVTPTFNLSG